MSEFITLHVGQCGNQIGGVFWPLVLQEYGVFDVTHKSSKIQKLYEDSYHCFFHNVKEKCDTTDFSNMRARALLIDMEENVVQRYRRGILKDIFDNSCSLTNHPGSGNNWAVGYYTHGYEQKSKLEEMIRCSVEKCESLHGFLSLFSLGGGTGSGLGTFILSLLENYYPKIDRIVSCVHPGKINDVITGPYNVSLSFSKLIESATCVIPVDNQALANLSTQMKLSRSLNKISFGDMNGIIAKMLLTLTSGARFPGTLNMDINELSVNMVPSPGLHFLSSSVAPLSNAFFKDNYSTRKREIFKQVCSPENHLLHLGSKKGVLFGTTLIIRREKISQSTIQSYISKINEMFDFTVWSRNGVKVGHCSVPPSDMSEVILLLTNKSEMANLFQESLFNFEKLYMKKAHVHHYMKVDGFEGQEFEDTREALERIINKYHIFRQEIKIPKFKIL